jgi:hypothetical protein
MISRNGCASRARKGGRRSACTCEKPWAGHRRESCGGPEARGRSRMYSYIQCLLGGLRTAPDCQSDAPLTVGAARRSLLHVWMPRRRIGVARRRLLASKDHSLASDAHFFLVATIEVVAPGRQRLENSPFRPSAAVCVSVISGHHSAAIAWNITVCLARNQFHFSSPMRLAASDVSSIANYAVCVKKNRAVVDR